MQNLQATAFKDLPDACISHMLNWCHSAPHFEFFREIFEKGSKEDGFDIMRLPDRHDIINHLHGFESATTSNLRLLFSELIN